MYCMFITGSAHTSSRTPLNKGNGRLGKPAIDTLGLSLIKRGDYT